MRIGKAGKNDSSSHILFLSPFKFREKLLRFTNRYYTPMLDRDGRNNRLRFIKRVNAGVVEDFHVYYIVGAQYTVPLQVITIYPITFPVLHLNNNEW